MSEQRSVVVRTTGVVVRTTVYNCIEHYTRIEDKKNTAKKSRAKSNNGDVVNYTNFFQKNN